MKSLLIVARIAAAGMLLWAVAPQYFVMRQHKYSYFELLRVVVCAVCAFGAYCAVQWKRTGWAVAFGFVAMLFNPLFPVSLGREAWGDVDVLTAVFLIASIFLLKHKTD